MAAKTKKKRKATPAQLAALARGRKKLSSKRPKAKSQTRKKASKPKVKRALRPKVKTTETKFVIVKPQEKKTMARKKSTKTTTKKKSSGRRRVAGFAGKAKGMIPVVRKLAMAVAGGVGAGVIANKVPVANPKVKAAIPVVAGIVMAATIGKKKPIFHEIGEGMAIIGAIGLLKQFIPNVPMLAGEEVIYIPDGSYPQEYAGEMMQLGYDEEDDLMGEMMQLGEEEEYLTAASI